MNASGGARAGTGTLCALAGTVVLAVCSSGCATDAPREPEAAHEARAGVENGRARGNDEGQALPDAARTRRRREATPWPDAPTADSDYAPVPRSEILDLYARTVVEPWSGDIYLHLAPGHYILEADGADSSDQRKAAFHLSAYDRERHVPLLVYVPGDPTPAVHPEPVSLESIGATLFDLLAVKRPPGVVAPALAVPRAGHPKLIVVLVMDALPYTMWDQYLGRQPNFAALRARGQEYSNTRLDYMSSSTTVSHSVLSTGLPPMKTGIPINYTRTGPGRKTEVFVHQDPSRLLAPTVADLYDMQHGNRPIVMSFSSQARAAIAMAGHGTAFPKGDPDLVVWQGDGSDEIESNAQFYLLPTYLQGFLHGYIDRAAGAEFLGRHLESPKDFFLSPQNVRIGEQVVSLMLANEPVGKGDSPDLLFFNQKVSDNIGHAFGPESLEYRAGLDELDAFIGRFQETLEKTVGLDYVLFVTADHGFGPSLGAASQDVRRHPRLELQATLEATFGTPDHPVFEDIQELNVYLNLDNLRANGHTPADVCTFLQKNDWVKTCLTRDEVLEERRRLGL